MSDNKKGPIVVGGIDTANDPVVRTYSKGVAERSAARRALKPSVGNLAAANEAYKPAKDGPMTIGSITEAHRRAEAEPEEPRTGGLSAKTIEGMQAMAQASQAARQSKLDRGQSPTSSPKETRMEETAVPEKTAKEKKEKEKISEAVENLDDFEFERIMRSIQNDVINNTQEKDHVNNPENKRLSEVDFAAGIATGEFRQWVHIVPDRLKVEYRTLTPMENQAIRLWIFQQVAENELLDKISGEMFGLGLIVASVIQIGTEKLPDHLKKDGQGTYSATFDDKAFAGKYARFARMPQQLIHALGTHGQWFDERMRKMFTVDHSKNG